MLRRCALTTLQRDFMLFIRFGGRSEPLSGVKVVPDPFEQIDAIAPFPEPLRARACHGCQAPEAGQSRVPSPRGRVSQVAASCLLGGRDSAGRFEIATSVHVLRRARRDSRFSANSSIPPCASVRSAVRFFFCLDLAQSPRAATALPLDSADNSMAVSAGWNVPQGGRAQRTLHVSPLA